MKTLGQIAFEASIGDAVGTPYKILLPFCKTNWELGADAIVEECVKALCWDCAHGDAPKFDGDAGMYLHEFEEQIPRGCAASELHSLRAANSTAGLKSPEGDTATAEHSPASLTQKSETPMTDHSDLIHWLRTFPFNGQMTTDQIGEAAGKCLEASEAIHSLRASLANEKEAREKLEFELAARDVNDPALDEAIDKMQEGFKIVLQHQSKRRKTT